MWIRTCRNLLFLWIFTGLFTLAFSEEAGFTLRAKVIQKLKSESILADTSIQVSTFGAGVKLSGKLDSEEQALRAIELAQSVPGVNEVDANELHVLGNQELLTDLVITAKIKGLLSQHQVFGDQDLSMVDLTIETHHGVVYLSGTLENQVEIQNVITLAGSVKGVKEVRVNLKLSAREPRPSSSLARANQ